MVGFSGILGIGQVEDQKIIKDNRQKKIVSRLKGKLVKMIKNSGSKYNYSISLKIRQTLLHWGYELTKKDFNI